MHAGGVGVRKSELQSSDCGLFPGSGEYEFGF